jgi:hypothetical protein
LPRSWTRISIWRSRRISIEVWEPSRSGESGSDGDVEHSALLRLPRSGPIVRIDRGVQRLRGALVTAQIALALVLLVGAGLMINSLVRVVEHDLGADSTNLLTFDVRLP